MAVPANQTGRKTAKTTARRAPCATQLAKAKATPQNNAIPPAIKTKANGAIQP